ncbi:cytidylyltransferase domain-containing protein [Kordiimonas sp.]|uniref:cytidylyltransferase domain-containing protein n=1 Tax=Kordiimonas sp. TaxID=1970157 RepID=UPI003A8DB208
MADKIVAIVGARLNSSRLPGKHLLPLAGKPMIARIIDRLRTVPELDGIMLATTADDYNKPLRDWAQGYGVDCLAYEGDVNDLVGRIDAAAELSGAAQILYICGDCPLIEPETLSRMIAAMAATPDAGLAKLRPPAGGGGFIHEGFDLYSLAFWRAMEKVAHEPFEREHVGAVYHHLSMVTPAAVAWAAEPERYATIEHRISVDTPSDYRFIRRIYADWYRENPDNSIVSLDWVMERLQREPDLAAINRHVHQKKVGENSAAIAIITETGPKVGMGHLSRSLVVAAALQDYLGAKAELFIIGEPIEREELKLIPHHWISENAIAVALGNKAYQACVVDMQIVALPVTAFLEQRPTDMPAIGIDVAQKDEALFDHVWVPSFYSCPERQARLPGKLSFGWDHFLLAQAQPGDRQSEKSLLVLTGGGDVAELGKIWPALIDDSIGTDTTVCWVRGPYADAPDIKDINGRWRVLDAPTDLADRLTSFSTALCVFGVSFFECLQANVPTVTFDPLGVANPEEWATLRKTLPAFVAGDAEEAVSKAAELLRQPDVGAEPQSFASKMREGPQRFALCMANLMQEKARA